VPDAAFATIDNPGGERPTKYFQYFYWVNFVLFVQVNKSVKSDGPRISLRSSGLSQLPQIMTRSFVPDMDRSPARAWHMNELLAAALSARIGQALRRSAPITHGYASQATR
jgi:hypothetical protein